MGNSAQGSEEKRVLPGLFGKPEFLPVPLFIILFVILYLAGPDLRSAKHVYEPPWLLFALNSVFITGLCLLVAWLSFRSYLRGGFLNVLLLGCGVLAFGLSSFVAGWLIRPHYGPNDTVTIHNVGVLFASVCFFLSSLSASLGMGRETDPDYRAPVAGAAYLGIFLLGALLSIATMLDLTPPFYIPGEGPSVIRQVVLAVSVTVLAVSVILMLVVYSERKSGFLLYFVIAMLLIGSGIAGVALGTPGSPLSWLGRASQYLGNVYLVIGAIMALGEAKSRGSTVEKALAEFFRSSETHYRSLVEMATDAIVACDYEGRILLMNPAAEQTFGYHRDEAIGKSMAELVVPGHSRGFFQLFLSGESCRNMELEMARKDGSIFPSEMSVSQEMKPGGRATRTIIIRDIAGRKKAEESLRESEVRFRTLAEATFEGIAITENGRFTDINEQFCKISGFDRSELLGMDVSMLVHPDDRDRVLGNILAERESTVEHRMFRKDGSPILIEAHGKTVRHDGRDRRLTAVRDITEARKARTEMRESEERYRGLFESMNEGFALHELLYDENGEPCDYRFLDVNPAFERQTGLKRENVVGKTVHEVLPGTEPFWIKRYGEVALTGKPAHFESRASALGRDYEVFAYRPAPGQFAAIFMDITDRRRAEDSLRASYDLLKIAQRAAKAGLWGWDIPTGKLTWSEEFYDLFGLGPEAEASFDTWFGVMHPDDRQPAMERIHRSIREGTPLENEYRIIRPDGQERWIRAWGSILYDESGQPLSMSGICIDATGSKRAEEALRRSEARYRSYNEVTGQMGWATDADGMVVDDVPDLRHYTGQTFDELRGSGWSRALHSDDVEITLAVWKKAVDGKQGYETEFRMRRHDGVYRHFMARGVPILNDDGSVREWVGTCIDVTERRGQEEELRKLNRTLRALSRSNEALMRAEEESAFLEEVCRIVIQDCGYAMVWIGYAEDDEDKTVRPVAHAGFSEGYLETLNLTWADRKRGQGPTGTAIRTGEVVLCTDMFTDPRFEPWRDEAVRRGYASSLALPLLEGGRAFGAVTIYSTQPDPFSADEIGLLSEMADDLTYGIASLRLRRQSRQTLLALQESEARFRLLSETTARLLVSEDPQGLIDDLCRGVMEHLDCQAFFNFMVDERAGRLRLNACAGIPDGEVRRLEWLDYGVAVCGCVARDKTRIIAEDIFRTPDERTELVRSYGIQAYCCHPLRAQERLIGTLSFGTKTRSRFTPEEVELMRTVADQVAVALQRVQAQQELRASEEALRLANEQLEQRVRERTTELILLLEDLEKGRDDLRRLASELVMAEERERKKISVLLHDEVAQVLAATKMRLDLLKGVQVDDEFSAAVSEARELLGQSIRQTRALMTDISNPVLYDMGLRVAVEALAEEVNNRQGIPVSCSFGGRLRNLGQDMEVMIFQVVKELVQNIVKHSRARSAGIQLVEEKNAVRAVVTDDGQGFDTGKAGTVQSEGGFGLFSIRERVKSYGGRIHIESGPGRGSEVTVILPKAAAGNTASLKARNRKKGA